MSTAIVMSRCRPHRARGVNSRPIRVAWAAAAATSPAALRWSRAGGTNLAGRRATRAPPE